MLHISDFDQMLRTGMTHVACEDAMSTTASAGFWKKNGGSRSTRMEETR
jgi:hypothetical protein